MKAGSAHVPGNGAAEFVDPPLELSEVSSVDVPENGGQESRDCTHGSDKVHDLHRNMPILSHGLKGSRGTSRHRTRFRLAEILSAVPLQLHVRPPFSER